MRPSCPSPVHLVHPPRLVGIDRAGADLLLRRNEYSLLAGVMVEIKLAEDRGRDQEQPHPRVHPTDGSDEVGCDDRQEVGEDRFAQRHQERDQLVAKA